MTRSVNTVSGIGSFFETPRGELLNSPQDPPWVNGPSVAYVQTARQAFAEIAAAYARAGRDTLVAPSYLCESMIAGFDLRHWELQTHRITRDLRVDADDLVAQVTHPDTTVVLSMDYFGEEPTTQHVAALALLRKQGARVIQDETHRVFGALDLVGDVAVASLRKLLPVADGAYVRGDMTMGELVDRPHLGWAAMDQKSMGDRGNAQAMFDLADEVLESHVTPAASASERTLEILLSLDYDALRSQRRVNADALRAYLGEIPSVEIVSRAEVPSHMVIRIDNPKRVQANLARANVFCPIHWPRPARFSNHHWPDDLLSLPVDHRYTPNDMARVAEQIDLAVVK